MERRKGTFNGNRNGNRNGSRGGFGKRTFGPTDAYELPSAASTLEEKVIVAALKRCGGDGVPLALIHISEPTRPLYSS